MASVRKRRWTHKGTDKEAWIVDYVDGAGKRRAKTFDKKKEADAFRLRVEQEHASGGVGTRMASTIRELAEDHLLYQELRMNDGRIGRGQYLMAGYGVNRHIIPRLGHLKLMDLTPAHVDDFYQALITAPPRVGNKRTPGRTFTLSPKIARERVKLLKKILDRAVARRWITSNAAEIALVQLQGITSEPIRTFTRAEIHALLSAVDQRRHGGRHRVHAFHRCCVYLAAFCGLRRGEIFGLTLESIDRENGVLHIRNNLTVWDTLKGPKTRSGRRDVPVPDHIMAMLFDWIERYYVVNERELVFRGHTIQVKRSRPGSRFGANGKGNPHDGFHSVWLRNLRDAGLSSKPGEDKLHFHALRHFAASFWIENGMSLPDVASLLGHSKYDVTLQTYAHPIVGGNQRREVIDRMSKALMAGRAAADATTAQHSAVSI